MKLREFYDNLTVFLLEKEENQSLIVISSADEEGNGYSEVMFSPTLGEFEDGSFEQEENFEGKGNINAICIN